MHFDAVRCSARMHKKLAKREREMLVKRPDVRDEGEGRCEVWDTQGGVGVGCVDMKGMVSF